MVNQQIIILPPATPNNRVWAIKALRSITFLGLKEAKDAIDQVGIKQSFHIDTGLPESVIKREIQILEEQGVRVFKPIWSLIDDLQRIGEEATEHGEIEFADEIMQLVVAEKLRRSRSI